MHDERRSAVLVYLGCVGVPLLALAVVLTIGKRIEAPPSIGGAWQFRWEGDGYRGPSAVTIAQAGPRFTVRGTALTGVLDGNAVRLQWAGSPCEVEATLTGDAGRRALRGRGFAAAGTRCLPVSVQGVQLEVAERR
jgi:hypothetical protein